MVAFIFVICWRLIKSEDTPPQMWPKKIKSTKICKNVSIHYKKGFEEIMGLEEI